MSMSKFPAMSRPAIRSILPYEPGKPIAEVEREFGLTGVIKLASNENPLGSSPLALEAVRKALTDTHRYPDGQGYYLKEKLSDKFEIPPNQIVLGNGSTELIELVTEAFVDEQDEVIIGREEFFKYQIAVKIMNGRIVWAKMPELQYDVDEILSVVTDATKVIFIANPNNPTGTLMDKIQVERLLDHLPEQIIVVFDEAYFEYRDHNHYPDTLSYIHNGRSIITLRTFSKSYGLAALRVGYAFSTVDICTAMNAVREAFNVNSLAQAAATAALDDNAFLIESIKHNLQNKRYFYGELDRLGVSYINTEANFILMNTPIKGRELFQSLLRRGVVVRPVDGYGLPDYIRVTIGLHSEIESFMRELSKLLNDR
jgi:histidinol-phosphate aminotransferase